MSRFHKGEAADRLTHAADLSSPEAKSYFRRSMLEMFINLERTSPEYRRAHFAEIKAFLVSLGEVPK